MYFIIYLNKKYIILFPPSILLAGLYEGSRSRINNISRLRAVIKELKDNLYNNNLKKYISFIMH
jgi:hypothetical protein